MADCRRGVAGGGDKWELSLRALQRRCPSGGDTGGDPGDAKLSADA